MGANWADVIWETLAWVLDNPVMSVSIVAGVVLSVVFALPDDPPHGES
jgi:hypothetical protein